jgi:hypothetical protein
MIFMFFKTPTVVLYKSDRGGIFKLLWSPEIDSKESIPPVYVAWRAGTRTLFLLGFWLPYIDCSKIPAQLCFMYSSLDYVLLPVLDMIYMYEYIA